MDKVGLIKFRRLFGQAGAVLALAGLCLPVGAGDKLNIGGAKTRIQPGSDDATSARIRATQIPSSPSPFDGVSPQSTTRRKVRDLKLEKKMQNERDERQNWALLAPGELQQTEGDEYDFGVRDYDLEDLEKKDTSRDYTFYGLDKIEKQDQARRLQASESSQRPETATRAQASSQTDAENGHSRPNADPNPFRTGPSGDHSRSQGAHMAAELDFNGMLGPARTDTDKALQRMLVVPDPALRSLLGSSISVPQQEEHQQRMDSFRRMLNNGLSRADVFPELLSDPADKTRQPLNPIVPSASQPASGSISRQQAFDAQNSPAAARGLARPDGISSTGPARNPAFSDPPQPALPQPERGPSRNFPGVEEIPRRKF